jgi:hypothetical protein
MYSGERKRPKNIVYFSNKNAQEEQSDFIQLISMMFGIASFLLKVNII